MKTPGCLLKLVGVVSLIVAIVGALPATAQSKSILQEVIHRGTIRIAVVGGDRPWSMIGPNGEPEGYEIDLAKQLAASLGVKPVFIITDIPSRPVMLESGKADVVIAQYTDTTAREKAITFTRPYMIIREQIMVRADEKGVNTIEDLNKPSMRIGATRGGTGAIHVHHFMPKATIVGFANINDELLALDAKQTDATSENWMWNQDMMRLHPGRYKTLPGFYSWERICIGLPKGDFDWWQILDNWVQQFNDSGRNNELFKHWFGYNLPPLH